VKSEADIWICGKCRSINPRRQGRCYRCNTPVEVAAARPEDLSLVHHEAPPEATGVFRSSELRAVFVTVATVAFVGATFVALWIYWTGIELRKHESIAAQQRLVDDSLPMLALAPIAGLLALLAFGFWSQRMVANLPTLGVGYSRVSPTWAFFEPLIPGFNIYSIPARMGEAIQKLGGLPRAMPLLGLALVLALAPVVVAAIVLRLSSWFATNQTLRYELAIAAIVVFAFQALALAIGLGVLWQIDGRARRLAESIAGK
jgi:hypothetical protein